jgi:hypothetical protein
MKPDDETFLSAYLDHELPLDQRERVDSALMSDSALADRLRDLAAVRDLVAGLARPALQVDVASSVVTRLTGRSSWRSVFPGADSWALRIAALTAAAATLLISTTIVVNRQLQRPGDSAPMPVAAAQPTKHEAVRPLPVIRDSEPVLLPTLAQASGPAAPVPPPQTDRSARDLRGLLENPQLQKVFFVTDVLGGEADARIGEMLESTPRRNPAFGRIVVHQGIVVDPAHAGEAIVFAVVMNESELQDFQKRLALAFPDAVEDAQPKRELALKLAEVGQIRVHPGIAAVELKPQPMSPARKDSSVALIHDPKMDVIHQDTSQQTEVPEGTDPLLDPRNRPFEQSAEIVIVPRDEPTPEQERSGPVPFQARRPTNPTIATANDATVGPPAPESIMKRARDRQAHPLVLVWVSTRAE